MTDNGAGGVNGAPPNFDDLVTAGAKTAADIQTEEMAGPLAKAWAIRDMRNAYEPRDPLQYVVDGLFATPSLNIVYGGPGSMKSAILADLAVCVAGGFPWLEPLQGEGAPPAGVTLQTRKSPVLWIDMDNGKRRSDVRFGAFGLAHGLPSDAMLHYVSMPQPRFNASDGQHMAAFMQFVQARGYKLIVIDNLGLSLGDVDENASEVGQVMANLRELAEESLAAVVVIHHQRKGTANTTAAQARKGDTLRGHSSIEASLDFAALVERVEGSDSIAIIPTKVRDYKVAGSLGARFTYTHVGESFDLETARFYSESIESPEELARLVVRYCILTALLQADGELSKTDLTDKTKGVINASGVKSARADDIKGQLQTLLNEGHIAESKGARNSYTYSLTEKGEALAKQKNVFG